MNFWIIAIAVLAVTAAIISWPFFSGSSRERFLGICVLVFMPLGGLLLYQQVGTPQALNAVQIQQPAGTADVPPIEELLAQLKDNLAENPNNPEGWMILGRSLKSMQQYPEALDAIERANELLPGSPAIMVELAEARLFASGNPTMGPEIRQLLESAVTLDPEQQKGLWLLGMAAAQEGDHQSAIDYWSSLLSMMDPDSNAGRTVAQQIESARNELDGRELVAQQPGQDPGIASNNPEQTGSNPALANTEESLNIEIGLGENMPTPPANTVLFVFVHPAGQRGMPLAVRRIESPELPLSISLSDADALRPGSSLTDHQQLDISARLSLSGVANAASGDYQANMATVNSDEETRIVLNLNQRVP